MSEQVNYKKLADAVREFIPNGDGYNSDYANTLADAADAIDTLQAEIELSRKDYLDLHSMFTDLQVECERLRREKSARQALSIQLIDEARYLRAELSAIKAQHQETVDALNSCTWALVHNPSCQRGVIRNCRCRDCSLMQADCLVSTVKQQIEFKSGSVISYNPQCQDTMTSVDKEGENK